MPAIEIHHRNPLFTSTEEGLIETISEACARCFSDDQTTFSTVDFSFMFHLARKPSDLTHDLIVRITVNDSGQRAISRSFIADTIAKRVSTCVANQVGDDIYTVGVTVLVAPIGWAEVSVPGRTNLGHSRHRR